MRAAMGYSPEFIEPNQEAHAAEFMCAVCFQLVDAPLLTQKFSATGPGSAMPVVSTSTCQPPRLLINEAERGWQHAHNQSGP